MEYFKEMAEILERSIHKYMQLEKRPRSYGDGIVLSQTEIHAIAAIGDHERINVTELAKLRGVTKGAASQLVYKLVDKGYIEKKTSPASDSEVCLTLTVLGCRAYEGHRAYHSGSHTALYSAMQDMPEETERYLLNALRKLEKSIDSLLESSK